MILQYVLGLGGWPLAWGATFLSGLGAVALAIGFIKLLMLLEERSK